MRGIVLWWGVIAVMFLMTAESAGAEQLCMQEGVYLIGSFQALEEFSRIVSETDGAFSGEARLLCNIEAERPVLPIGSPEHMFLGVFDGMGHAISGLHMEGGEEFQGLFGYIGVGGEVRNLTLRDVWAAGTRYVGGIAAFSAGKISRCRVEGGRITCTGTMEYSAAVGGVAGLSCGVIEHCMGYGATVAGGRCVGGIVGSQCAAKVEGCVGINWVRSWSAGHALVGGVAGSVRSGGEIRRCISAGMVRAPRAMWTGGVAGGLLSGNMSGCISLGPVEGQEAGGVAGYAAQHAQIMNCHYVPWSVSGVGEGRQAGVREIAGGRRWKPGADGLWRWAAERLCISGK